MIIVNVVCQPQLENHRRNQVQMKLDTSSLAHMKWECKYHIVFAPKYRRQIIYGKIKMDIGQMLRKLCEYKGTAREICAVGRLFDEPIGSAEGIPQVG